MGPIKALIHRVFFFGAEGPNAKKSPSRVMFGMWIR